MTPPNSIHPVAKLFLDFAQDNPKISFQIKQDGGSLTPETQYQIRDENAHLTTTQQDLMNRRGTLGAADLDQIFNPNNPKPVEKQQGVNIFTHDGGTTHPETWWEGHNGSLEKSHQPSVQISALDLSKADTQKLLGELNAMLKQKGLAGEFEQKAMNGYTQQRAPGVSLINYPNSVILTVRTGELSEPALTV